MAKSRSSLASARTKLLGRALLAAVASLSFSTASAGRDLRDAVPAIALPERFAEDPAGSSRTGNVTWWRLYGDQGLERLVAKLHANNTGIAQARARLAEAEAAARAGAASQAPSADINLSASSARGPLVNAAGESGNLYAGRLSISWEADLFGRLSGERYAEKLDVAATEALLADTTLLMEGRVARAWFSAQRLSSALVAVDRIVRLQGEALEIMQRRRSAGLISALELDDIQARLQAAIRRQSQLTLARSFALRELGFLLGETAGIEVGPTEAPSGQLPEIAAGMPSELLLNRPDIAAARNRLLAADGRLRSARKGWLPVLGLTASGGGASASLSQIVSGGAGSFLIGALLSLPALDGGRQKARVAGRIAGLELAEVQYRETVLAALRDVNNHLLAYQHCRRDLAIAVSREGSASSLLTAAHVRAENGTISRIAEIDAEMRVLQSSLDRADVERSCYGSSVDLLQSLGGSS